jgi:hypothetical protein
MGGKMIAGFGIGATLAMGITYLAEVRLDHSIRDPNLLLTQTDLTSEIASPAAILLDHLHRHYPGSGSWGDQDLGSRREGTSISNCYRNPVGCRRSSITCLDHCSRVSLHFVRRFVLTMADSTRSPLWLIRKQKIDRARKVMQRLYGPNDSEERLAREIHIVRIENENASLSPEITWMSCFRGTDSKRTATTALLFSLTNLAGAAFLSQNIYFLITAGLEAVHSFDIGIGGFAFAAILIACSGLYLQKVSRRNAIIGGLIFNLVFMIIIGALYFAPGRGAIWAIAILMNVLISFQAAILQGVGWAVAAEVPTPNLRAKTLSLGLCGQTLTTWLFQFVTPYMYNVDSGRLGSRVGFVHAGITVLVLAGAWFLVPDTTNMTTQEIDEAYHNGVGPRNFQKYISERNAQESSSINKAV